MRYSAPKTAARYNPARSRQGPAEVTRTGFAETAMSSGEPWKSGLTDSHRLVIPAKAGIQGERRAAALDPRFRGGDEQG